MIPNYSQLNNYRSLIILSVFSSFIALVPIWLATSAVYRASLPFDSIKEEWNKSFPIEFPIDLQVYFDKRFELSDRSFVPGFKTELGSFLEEKCSVCFKINSVSIDIGWNRPEFEDERNFLHSFEEKFDERRKKVHYYSVYIAALNTESNFHIVEFGHHRNLLIRSPVQDNSSNSASLKTDIARIISSIFKREMFRLNHMEESSRNVLAHSSAFLVTFSLMNGDSDNKYFDWEISEAFSKYFLPLLSQLQLITRFETHAQLQEHANISVVPYFDDETQQYQLKEDQLPYLVNFADWKLDSKTTNLTEINFILYIPPNSKSPLQIVDKNGQAVGNNAILLPRWGGLAIFNEKVPLATQKVELDLGDLKNIFEIFVSQMRDLIGIESARTESDIDLNIKFLTNNYANGVSAWEMDMLLRRRLVGNLKRAASTLVSLVGMLEKLTNIEVNDNIKHDVELALMHLKTAQKYVSGHGDIITLISAYQSSKLAVEQAEAAFFDPTMTSLLYFPDEHLLAVYAPYLLPVAISILISILRLLKILVKGHD